jgi:hypothetical protein
MKYRSTVSCFYCASDDLSEFICSTCEVHKCLECVSRFEAEQALCVECLQNSGDTFGKVVIRIVAPFLQHRGSRILFVGGPDLRSALQKAMSAVQSLPRAGETQDIVIRIDSDR